MLPTFALVAGQGPSAGDDGEPAGLSVPGVDVDLARLLHAGQALTVHRPLPAAGTVHLSSRVADVWDKGKAAMIILEQQASDPDGGPLWTTQTRVWARGEGGFGGSPGPKSGGRIPDREPDVVFDTPTADGQALWYRLNGDLNPLHADPEFARSAGFEHPILHGLASYGIVAKAICDRELGGDPHALLGIDVRFSGSLVPGETISTRLWRTSDGLVFSSSCPERDGAAVLSGGLAQVAS